MDEDGRRRREEGRKREGRDGEKKAGDKLEAGDKMEAGEDKEERGGEIASRPVFRLALHFLRAVVFLLPSSIILLS